MVPKCHYSQFNANNVKIILSSNWSVQVCMVYNSTNANERAQLNQLPRIYMYIFCRCLKQWYNACGLKNMYLNGLHLQSCVKWTSSRAQRASTTPRSCHDRQGFRLSLRVDGSEIR